MDRESDKKREILEGLASSFRYDLSKGMLLVLECLEDVSPKDLKSAAVRLMKTSKFMPTVHEILQSVDVGDEFPFKVEYTPNGTPECFAMCDEVLRRADD